MAKSFELEPKAVERVVTGYRRIVTPIPVPESLEILRELRACEPVSMSGQPLVVWDRGEGFQVHDKYGNTWIDFSSGVLVANAGHGNQDVIRAVTGMANHGLLHNYCFPSEIRAKLVRKLVDIAPKPLEKVFLLTTGSEACECVIKLARSYGRKQGGIRKIKIVTFHDDFHGRTLGSQMAGGLPGPKEWIVNLDPDLNQVPFPNPFRYHWADESRPDYSDQRCFDTWLGYLEEQGITPDTIAAFFPETFQGGWAHFMPVGFAKKLRAFCDRHDILLAFDEIQAGFGRSGKLFSFQHYGISPDLVCLGKGITSSLPLSAVIGRRDVMDLYGPNQMTSTHTGNPVCCAAALANIEHIMDNGLIQRAAELDGVCRSRIKRLKERFGNHIGSCAGKGLVWALVLVKKGTAEMDCSLAHDVVRLCVEKGLLFFAPVGAGSTIKICPPLVIPEDALEEGMDVLEQAMEEALEMRR